MRAQAGVHVLQEVLQQAIARWRALNSDWHPLSLLEKVLRTRH
ncbi:MAG: hypothetical protein U1F68_01205 [Gammaproteobacteria bacterium]